MILKKFADIARLQMKENELKDRIPRFSRTPVISRLFGVDVDDQARVGPREPELQEVPAKPSSVVFIGDGWTVPHKLSSFIKDNEICSKGSHSFDSIVLNMSYPEMTMDDFFNKKLFIKWARAMPDLTVLHFGGINMVKDELLLDP